MGLLLFGPAWTFDFPGAWRIIAILFIPMLIVGVVLFIKNPDLLAKRLNQKEGETEQKWVIILSAVVFVICFVLCALDFRFGWAQTPFWVSMVGCGIFLLTYLGFAELLRENAYLSRTVEVQEDQKVVSTGLYGIVRHPMYAIIFWMFLSMPIIIGSFIGLIPMVLLPYILARRIANEEQVLKTELKGYEEYCQKVKYRLIPFIW